MFQAIRRTFALSGLGSAASTATAAGASSGAKQADSILTSDLNGDGVFDIAAADIDGDGLYDIATADLTGDGVAETVAMSGEMFAEQADAAAEAGGGVLDALMGILNEL